MYEAEATRPFPGSPPPPPGQQSPIGEAFSVHDRGLEELERQIEVLTNRLTPVLRMEEAKASDQPRATRRPGATPLAEMMAQRTDRLDASIFRLDKIIHLIGL